MKKAEIKEWIGLIFGVSLMAFGIQCFLEPAKLVAGGITGVGIILDEITMRLYGIGTSLWLVNIVLNLPLFLWAWKKQGGRFLGKTILTAFLLSGFLYIVESLHIDYEDSLLASVYGGALVGIGTGYVLRAGATTGGVDLAAALLNKINPRFGVAKGILVIDAIIIFAGMGLFGAANGLYAILSVFVTERCTTWVLEGITVCKGVFIISDRPLEIRQALLHELSRGVTSFQGKGGYTGEEKEILFCLFAQNQVHSAKAIITKIDENAFFFMTDIRETFGEGFIKQ